MEVVVEEGKQVPDPVIARVKNAAALLLDHDVDGDLEVAEAAAALLFAVVHGHRNGGAPRVACGGRGGSAVSARVGVIAHLVTGVGERVVERGEDVLQVLDRDGEAELLVLQHLGRRRLPEAHAGVRLTLAGRAGACGCAARRVMRRVAI